MSAASSQEEVTQDWDVIVEANRRPTFGAKGAVWGMNRESLGEAVDAHIQKTADRQSEREDEDGRRYHRYCPPSVMAIAQLCSSLSTPNEYFTNHPDA